MRLVLLLLVTQLIGTFLVLIVRPDLAFENGNPLLLTTEGEFIVKNLVLISAGLTVGSQVRTLPGWKTSNESKPNKNNELAPTND